MFDLVFVLKDYSKAPIHVNTIDMADLNDVQEWLDECNVKFYSTTANINWGAVMKTVRVYAYVA